MLNKTCIFFILICCTITLSNCTTDQYTSNHNDLIQKNGIPSLVKLKTEVQTPNVDSIPIGIQKLLKAYPNQLIGAEKNAIIWKDGSKMVFDDELKNKSHEQLLNAPDLEDQLAMPYQVGKKYAIPSKNFEPGRIRYEPFFKKMYGASAKEVRKHLTTIIWLPKQLNKKLRVTKINGIDKKIQAISNELDKHPKWLKYLKNPGGTFNWRVIAGTKRLSMHSFGATIDINIKYANYWRWEGYSKKNKRIKYRNKIPLELVELFEKHGFIWGGKWYHYDTMHFEYRPELTIKL